MDPIVEPSTRDELASMLDNARRERRSVLPWGSGSHQAMGHPPAGESLKIYSGKLNRILEHSEKDLTVTVEAGVMLGDLQKTVSGSVQFFPFWAPDCDGRTLGGILSTGEPNFFLAGRGNLRDLVLGFSVCHPDGKVTKSGGKVVKNVSGYEMPKLYVGSMGTLAFVAACTLKLAPKPELTLFISGEGSESNPGFRPLHRLFKASFLMEGAFLRLRGGKWRLVAIVSGKEATTRKEAEKISAALWQEELAEIAEVNRDEAEALLTLGPGAIRARGLLPPASVQELWPALQRLSSETGLDADSLFAHHGGFFAAWDGEIRSDLVREFENFNRWIGLNGGSVIYEKVPESLWSSWPMWGEERSEWEISSRLKKAFDPGKILNPGRFVGRI